MWPLESEAAMTEPCFDYDLVQNISAAKVVPDISSLCFRNLDVFIAGQLHLHSELWKKIAAFSSYDRADEVLAWINDNVSLYMFFPAIQGKL